MPTCKDCGQPMLPKGGVKKPNEYDHARGCPSDLNKRDPRVEPRPEDILHIGGTYRHVRRYKRGVSFWQRIGNRSWTLENVPMAEWREWAKNAEVIHAAD